MPSPLIPAAAEPSSATLARPKKHWTVPPRQPEVERRLMSELGIQTGLAAVLVARGFTEPAAAHAFLHPRLEDLHDPMLLPDADPAIGILRHAIAEKEKIFIHGDYDVDGVTSASLLGRFLKSLKADVKAHVPHRMKEGYGIHLDAVEAAKAYGARVFLTCDCGSSAHLQVLRAHEAGMKVVVTDHHEVGDDLPCAEAVVNPHRSDSRYPFPYLSGVGVAFKLAMGMAEQMGLSRQNFCRAFLDLTAIGTVADMMPLTDENRIIGRFGFELIKTTKKAGLRALMAVSGIDKRSAGRQIEGCDISFSMAPRLNAAGRVDDAAIALQLLLTEDPAEAMDLAQRIETLNTQRKDAQSQMVDEVIAKVKSEPSLPYFLLAGDPGWHRGVVGIAAGKVVNEFFRPTLIVSVDEENGTCHGSARSIPGFSVSDAIHSRPDLMHGGGHAAAAGCSFRFEHFDEVKAALNQYAEANLEPEMLIPRETLDADLDPSELTVEGVHELSQLEPCGMENPRPKFLAEQAEVTRTQATKDGKHLQMWFRHGGTIMKSIYFNGAAEYGSLPLGTKLDVAYQPEVNDFGGSHLEWRLLDVS